MKLHMLMASGGVVLGLAFGVATRLVLKLMHRRGHKAPEQLALIVAMAYLSFYVANGPCETSLLLQQLETSLTDINLQRHLLSGSRKTCA